MTLLAWLDFIIITADTKAEGYSFEKIWYFPRNKKKKGGGTH